MWITTGWERQCGRKEVSGAIVQKLRIACERLVLRNQQSVRMKHTDIRVTLTWSINRFDCWRLFKLSANSAFAMAYNELQARNPATKS